MPANDPPPERFRQLFPDHTRVGFIHAGRFVRGYVVRMLCDGITISYEIARERGGRPAWEIPADKIVKAPEYE